MSQHALRTALTLYRGETLDLETAARQAGVPPARLERRAAACTVPEPEATASPELDRVQVASD